MNTIRTIVFVMLLCYALAKTAHGRMVGTQASVPEAPSSINALAIEPTSVVVSWTPSVSATVYHLWRWNYAVSPAQFTPHITSTQVIITDTVNCNELQFYQVRAGNADGVSGFTPWTSVMTPACPSVVSTLAAPANLTATAVSTAHLRVSWDASPDATGYHLWRWNYYANPAQFEPFITTTLRVVTDTIGCGQTQFYQVRATNGVSVSEFSAWVMQTAKACFAGPLQISVTAVSTDSLSVSWPPATDALGYKVYAWSPEWGQYLLKTTVLAPAVSYTETVGCGTSQWYRVSAYDATSESLPTASMSGTTPSCPITQPSAPTVTVLNQSPTSITLSWTALAGVENYLIYKKIGSLFLLYSSTSAPLVSWTDADLPCNAVQRYKVSARNGFGEGQQSDEMAVSTLPCLSKKVYVPFAVR